MLTEVEEKATAFICSTTCRLGIIPCDWDPKAFRLSRTKSKGKKLFERLNAFYVLFYVLYEVYRFPVTMERFRVTKKSGMLMFHSLVFLRDLANLGLRFNTYLYMDGIIILFNQTIFINKSLGKSVLNKNFRPKGFREKFYIGCQAMLCTAGLCLYSVFFVKPTAANYLYSSIPSDYHNPLTFLIFASLEILLSTNVGIVGFNLLMLFCHLLSMNFWIKKVCVEWPEHEILSAGKSIRVYRSIFVLNKIYNQTYSKLVVPGLKYIMSCAAMITFFSGVTNYDATSIEANICILIAVSCYFQLIPGAYIMSSLDKFSAEYKGNMMQYAIPKLTFDRNYVRRFLKSCGPIRCKIGSVYYMDKGAQATLIDFIMNGTIFLFLTYN